MKLEQFKEKDHKKRITIGISIVLVLLIAGIIIYRSFAFYEERKAFDVIKGQVPDQNYDLKLSYYVDNNYQETMPEGTNYRVSVTCSDGATGEWDYELWGPVITNLTNTRTKCKIYFSTSRNLIDVIKEVPIVTSGTGLYEVSHSDANITYTNNTTAINNLKQTELRYAGSDPNNYVTFNNELWRMIGLVNTPEGQRIKLVRKKSIGDYSWDTSASNVNNGLGINEWSQADIKNLLNSGAYYNRTAGTCYNGRKNATVSCDFSETGLTNEAKEMIDTVTWHTGTTTLEQNSTYETLSATQWYNIERSSYHDKPCSGTNCNDTVTRTTSWKGKIALYYRSDQGYATSGGTTADRNKCLSAVVCWHMNDGNCTNKNLNIDCFNNQWLSGGYLITPRVSNWEADGAYTSGTYTVGGDVQQVTPTLHLLTSIKVTSGDGTIDHPYVLIK